MFISVMSASGGGEIWESRNHGWTWMKGDSLLIKNGAAGKWDDIIYQSSIFGIDEGSHMSLGVVFSGYYDSSGTTIWHTGYKEVPFRPTPRTPAPSSWVHELGPGNILGNMRTDDSTRCTFPYFSGTDWVTFMDTCIVGTGIHDTVAASYTFEAHVIVDSIKFYRSSVTTVVDSFAIIIPKTGAVFADSVHASSSGSDVGASESWGAGSKFIIGNTFTAGQEIAFKWVIAHTSAGNFLKMKRIVLFGKRYYD
jgi:hypothetical protein